MLFHAGGGDSAEVAGPDGLLGQVTVVSADPTPVAGPVPRVRRSPTWPPRLRIGPTASTTIHRGGSSTSGIDGTICPAAERPREAAWVEVPKDRGAQFAKVAADRGPEWADGA
ncbi:hypothetical protein Rwratislav_44061 [Rhodococcus wratislaviensis IFP 2016]|nr:hypothetical protein Rwratislav_44061 [Rhodococcus wratislaviensis IFP 2016]